MSHVTVAFLTHPLGERDADWGSGRGNNLSNAIGWFRFLKDATGWAIVYTSMTYSAALDDALHWRSMIVDAALILERCDVLVAVGGFISPHMRVEIAHARGKSPPIPVMNLTDLGIIAPGYGDAACAEVRKRAEAIGIEF